jgi:hypothetical protein
MNSVEVDNADMLFYFGHGNPQVITFTAGAEGPGGLADEDRAPTCRLGTSQSGTPAGSSGIF